MSLCEGEVTAEERTGISYFFKFKPNSNDKMNQKQVPVILKTKDLYTGYTFNPCISRRNTSLKGLSHDETPRRNQSVTLWTFSTRTIQDLGLVISYIGVQCAWVYIKFTTIPERIALNVNG
jgi:hypothetical protein